MHDPSAHDKGAEAPRGFGWRRIDPPVGCKQARPSSRPSAASAISPGPFRGWGRHPLACIHTQREPVVPPVGTGTEYRRPQAVSWHLAALRAKASGDRSWMDGSTSISGIAANAIRRSNDLLALPAGRPVQDAHTVAEGNARWGVPRGAGGLPRRRQQQPAWQRETWASVRLGAPTRRAGCAAERTVGCAALACRGTFDRLRALAVRVAAARPERAALAAALAHR